MKPWQNIFLSFFAGMAITVFSLEYTSSYELCIKLNCETRPAWGSLFAYVFDGEGSSPAMGINVEDDLVISRFVLNVGIYASALFLICSAWSGLKQKRALTRYTP